jgi:hypothetical protein
MTSWRRALLGLGAIVILAPCCFLCYRLSTDLSNDAGILVVCHSKATGRLEPDKQLKDCIAACERHGFHRPAIPRIDADIAYGARPETDDYDAVPPLCRD